jgi:hypothetical protein
VDDLADPQGRLLDPTVMPAETILRMVTSEGARAA